MVRALLLVIRMRADGPHAFAPAIIRPRRLRNLVVATLLLSVALAGLVVGPSAMTCWGGGSKVDIAKLTIKKYAYEAYPEFLAANPARSCPDDLYELNAWMNNKDIRDPWGTPYQLFCATSPKAHAIVVRSAGEDAMFDTADDYWSNQ